jgi:hypothetical protein
MNFIGGSLPMHKFLINLATAFIFLGTSGVYGQVVVSGNQKAENFEKNVYGLGISAGLASGIGISFRDHLASKSSFQIVGGIIKVKDKVSSSIGAEYQYDLVRGASTRFFFGPGVSYFYSGDGGNQLAGPFRCGIGIGGEFNIQESLHFTLEGMFTYFSDGTILPLPQASFHYYFY